MNVLGLISQLIIIETLRLTVLIFNFFIIIVVLVFSTKVLYYGTFFLIFLFEKLFKTINRAKLKNMGQNLHTMSYILLLRFPYLKNRHVAN
jgi:hypothetical protein